MPVESNTVWITENNADVTTTDGGGNSGTFEEIFDLQTPTDVVYKLRPEHMMADRLGLRVRMDLDSSAPADLPDDSVIMFAGQEPVQEDRTQIGTTRTLRQFNNADQYNEDEVFRFDITEEYTFTEDAHLKIYLDSATAVSWADSYIEMEVVRVS